jgi:tungstate transport system permease protein
MHEILQALITSFKLVGSCDPEVLGIVLLSLRVSLSASIIALLIGAPLAGVVAITHFRGQKPIIVLANAMLGLPPVVVGLALYLLLTRSGPLGSAGLLFSPSAMVMAQTVLATPIVLALWHRAAETLWSHYGDLLRTDGATMWRSIMEMFIIGQGALLTTFLAAFGRAIAEVGAIIIVGGNIRGYTRTMTTTIALETSKGDLPLALALGLILILLSIAVSAAAFLLADLAGQSED